PYIWIITRERTASDTLNEHKLYLVAVDQLINGSMNATSNHWLLYNASIGTIDIGDQNLVDYEHYLEDITRVFLSLNSTGQVAGITCYQADLVHIPMNVPVSDTTSFGREFPTFKFDDWTDVPAAARVTSFNIEHGTKTFQCQGLSPYLKVKNGSDASHLGIGESLPGGIPMGLIPIRTSAAQKNTSLALVMSTELPNYRNIDKETYPFVNSSIVFLPGDYVGVYQNSTVTSLDLLPQVEFSSTNRLDLFSNNFINSRVYRQNVEFDIDGDGLTDIPIAGTSMNTTEISNANVEGVVNGPFFTVTQAGVVNQTTFLSLADSYELGLWVSDANEDGVSDGLLADSYMIFSQGYPSPLPSFADKRLSSDTTRSLFIAGIVMVVAGGVMVIVTLATTRGVPLLLPYQNRKRVVLLLTILAVSMVALFSQLASLTDNIRRNQGSQIGVTAGMRALASLTLTSGLASFVMFFALFFTTGLYMLVTPRVSDGIVSLNEVFYARRAGLKAAMKKEELRDEEVEKSGRIAYKIIIVPPFGRKITTGVLVGRILSVMALAIAVGLNVFEYGTMLYDAYGVSSITTIKGLADQNFVALVSALFTYMIIPGIVAIPLFFWLLPTSWLLNDAGVFFYKKSLKSVLPEDVEPIGNWFSHYLKGFLGIGAIVSYVKFILESPITISMRYFAPQLRANVVIFVFGFIVIAGLAFGIMVATAHEMMLPYNASRLYQILEERHVDTTRKEILFESREKLTPEVTETGFLGERLARELDVEPAGENQGEPRKEGSPEETRQEGSPEETRPDGDTKR
ncbi:MAG: hypothetical protein ACTSU5_14325, partial [Promethearchaeota archaeon]